MPDIVERFANRQQNEHFCSVLKKFEDKQLNESYMQAKDDYFTSA